ncbi:MAG TPA: DEAD/DEAH box helicase [Candidatus Paceibacterota bacterium]|nr:DEAD/DEAH box helicase [Verrucomicrobiota bacterium]HRY51385.1 DEAD/DEAH box helicase [Candidatus Paceibacterota bacterium]
MDYSPQRALELLRLGTLNPSAVFHPGQEEAIRHIVEGRGRLLVVQKTGWGKSLVYFIAARLLREQGSGPALLISPLLALMRNQIGAAERMGVRALTIHSENREAWPEVEAALARHEVDILLISPERLANDYFRSSVLGPVAMGIGLLVVDEAHCISDWGHDFRPHYRFIERLASNLPPNLRLLATTATANNRVLEDLQAVLGPDLAVSRGDLARPSLLLQTIRMPSQAERLAWLAERLPSIAGSGIIYTLTVRDALEVADWLRARGLIVEAYTSETGDRRVELEAALLANRVKALVATTALGMGFDKPDLAFVIHYQTPGSVVAYYQQVGRAGRALGAAHGVLLSGGEESEITDYFIENAFPTKEEVNAVLAALKASRDGLSVNEIMAQVNATKGRIDKALLLLSLESPAPVAKLDSKWRLAPTNLSDAFWQRAERLTALRREEQSQMQDYVRLTSGHMEFLIRALDGDPGDFHPPKLEPLPLTTSGAVVQDAVAFLRRTNLPIEPRERWPVGGLPRYQLKGMIAPEHRLQPGRILSVWGDAGWAELVRAGKYSDHHYSDELVAACVTLIKEWNLSPAPEWVCCIPSRRHPELVPDFARRLAEALHLPFHPVLEQTKDRPEQKLMVNSIQQARNVDGSLMIRGDSLLSGPVLLLDGMVASRWTLTLAAWLLRSHGSGPVYPLALASTTHRKP